MPEIGFAPVSIGPLHPFPCALMLDAGFQLEGLVSSVSGCRAPNGNSCNIVVQENGCDWQLLFPSDNILTLDFQNIRKEYGCVYLNICIPLILGKGNKKKKKQKTPYHLERESSTAIPFPLQKWKQTGKSLVLDLRESTDRRDIV